MEFSGTYATYQRLGGSPVKINLICKELSRMPLDGVLGCLTMFSLDLVTSKEGYHSRIVQDKYLIMSLLDGFPKPLRGKHYYLSQLSNKNSSLENILIHEQNIAWLTHLSILYSNKENITLEITESLKKRVCRLLLIANDFISVKGNNNVDIVNNMSLTSLKEFAFTWLKNWQFNRYYDEMGTIMIKLARQCLILTEILPETFDVETSFIKATGGITLERYFHILISLVAFIYTTMKPGMHWMTISALCSNMKTNKTDAEVILGSWTQNVDQYKEKCKEYYNIDGGNDYLLGLSDYIPLRDKPLIEARTGEMICPSLPYLLAKISDGPYYILSQGDDPGRFHVELGNAYHKYAHTLVKRIAVADKDGLWKVEESPQKRKGGELADSFLMRGDTGISFEHKGQRAGNSFLKGISCDLVLGPSDDILNEIDAGKLFSSSDILKSKQDKGLLTKGMWQQTKYSNELINWSEDNFGSRPKKIYPITTHLADLHVDEVCRQVFIDPLIKRAGLFTEEFWQCPQWLNIDEFEMLVDMVEKGVVGFEEFLNKKLIENPIDHFDIYIKSRYNTKFFNQNLYEKCNELLNNTIKAFFNSDYDY